MPDFISIDQNTNTLWDTVPKLVAMVGKGYAVEHFLEDVDMAFTRHGAVPGDSALEVVRERYYRGGTSDWGAALFYSDFLGRLPLDVRRLEPYMGWTTAALSRRLDCSVDDLYDRYSPSDNWQLVGASYAGDDRHHRVIGDVTADVAGEHILHLLDHARDNLLRSFPEPSSQYRVEQWFSRERSLVANILAACEGKSLPEVYRRWVSAKLPEKGLSCALTSELFAPAALSANAADLLNLFVRDHAAAAALYNQAIEETGVGLTPLSVKRGELPFFLVVRRQGMLVRTAACLEGSVLVGGDLRWQVRGGKLPLARMAADGVVSVVGKALLLVLQVRLKPDGCPLALPYQGSLYMPAAYAFEKKLRDSGILTVEAHPVARVRFRFFESWRNCQTLIRPPTHLRHALGVDELPARELADVITEAQEKAEDSLRRLGNDDTRDAALAQIFPKLWRTREQLDGQRRELARAPETRPAAKEIWDQIKTLDRELLENHLGLVLGSLQIQDLHYYDSRGALEPWCVALGGDELYRSLLAGVQIEAETDDGFQKG
ncbi:MAG: hypothetical protein KAI66_01950 [Lentisphaeria bacterium]|nr:hypothetical protein [Lentisphaeria bacterium]